MATRKLQAFRLPPASDEHIVRLQKALNKKMPGKVSKADVVAWALEVTAERLPPPRRATRSPAADLRRLRSAVTERTPEEHRDQTAALYVLDALASLLAAAEHWPDPADAVDHVVGYASAPDKLGEVAPWLARVAELVPVLDPEDESSVDTPECIAEAAASPA